MKRRISVLLACLLIIGIATAVKIDIDVTESLKIKVITLSYNEKENLIKFSTELFNTGSSAYKARVRIDILENNKTIFTGWSKEKEFMPGNRANFDIFWYSKESGNFTVQMRVYFGNEILLHDKINFTVSKSIQPTGVFEVSGIKTYDDKIIFDIETEANAILIPYKYPVGWIFEQTEVKPDNPTHINYIPSLWTPNNYLTVLVVSEDGKRYIEKTFKMEKEVNEWENILNMIKYLFLPIRILL